MDYQHMNSQTQKFFKYAALYMGSSVDSLTALQLAKRRVRHKGLLVHIEKMLSILSTGVSMSEASKVLKDKKCIDGVCWSMLSSAEKSGSLLDSMDHVSRYLLASAKVKKSLISSLAYPIGVVFMATSMVYFLISFIFPKITPLLSSLHAPIPPTTMFLMFLSEILRKYIFHLLVGVGCAIAFFMYEYRTNLRFRFWFQNLLLKTPLARQVIFSKESHGLALSCGVLMKGGKSLTESLHISHDSTDNLVMKRLVSGFIQEIELGRNMSDALKGRKMFEGEWADLISVGEMAGTLPQSFTEIAECFENRLKEDLELIARWAEPLALLLSASVILIVAMSVIQPMYAILQYVHS